MSHAIVDADIIAYRISFACKDETEKHAKYSLDNYLNDILTSGVDTTYPDCFVDSWKLYLTGKNNFRVALATTAVYKGNRTAPKPEHLPALRQHMVKEWDAEVVDGQEADDKVAIEATRLGDNGIIVTLDKDINQVSGWHYNFVKKEGYYITPQEGLVNFYRQILTGDSSDNIIGIRGIGPVKAAKILEECEDAFSMYQCCVEAYEGNEERVIENARLLWLRRYDDEPLWIPPERIDDDNTTSSKQHTTSE